MAARVDSPRTVGEKKCRESGLWTSSNRFSLHDDDDDDDCALFGSSRDASSNKTGRSGDHSQALLLDALHENNNSQFSIMSHSQAMSEVLTQNAEFTQLTQDDEAGLSLSPLPPYSPINPKNAPWGRLIPSFGDSPIDLLPRPPEKKAESETPPPIGNRVGFTFKKCGLEGLQPSDLFNAYFMGRSSNKSDVVATNPTASSDSSLDSSEYKLRDWAYGMISNRHCRIFCTLKDENAALAAAAQNSANSGAAAVQVEATCGVDVWVENFSNNGTVINQTTVLQKGQKRLLHSGDEVSLVNPETLRKKIPNSEALIQRVIQRHSYVFLNVVNQPVRQQLAAVTGQRMLPPKGRQSQNLLNASGPSTSSCIKQRRGLVDVRAMNYHARHQKSGGPAATTTVSKPIYRPSPVPPGVAAAAGSKRTPKSGNVQVVHRSNYTARPVPGAPLSPIPSPSPPRESFRPLRRVEEEYDIRDKLGAGTSGEVRRAIHRATGKEFAVKVISLGLMGGFKGNKNKEAKSMEAEARILQSLDQHPYITKFYDVFVAPGVAMYLVMELLKGGDLFDRIVERTRYTEVNSRRSMRRLLAAIHYLHEDCNIVHRDLKPENIMLKNRQNDIDICLTDFGLAKRAGKGGLKTFCGTDLYLAPEVLQRRHSVKGLGHYGKGADMWSAGVILFILLSGGPPFDVDGGGMDTVLHNSDISFPTQLWSDISADAKDLVKRMLVADPQARISVREACEHKWFLEDDGDTHKHPLDDPKLPSRTRKRLFTSCPTATPGNGESSKYDVDPEPPVKKQVLDGCQTIVDQPEEESKGGAESSKIEHCSVVKANSLIEAQIKADGEELASTNQHGGSDIIVQLESPELQDKLGDAHSTSKTGGPGDRMSEKETIKDVEMQEDQDSALRQRSQLGSSLTKADKRGQTESKTEKVSFQLAEIPMVRVEDGTAERPAEFPLSPNHMPHRFREAVEKNIQCKKKQSNKTTTSKLPDGTGESSTHDTPRQTSSSKVERRQGRKVTPFAAAGEELAEDEIKSQFSDEECESINSFGASQGSNTATAPSGSAGEGKSLTQSTLSPFAAPRAKATTKRLRKGGSDDGVETKPAKAETLQQATLAILPALATAEASSKVDNNNEQSVDASSNAKTTKKEPKSSSYSAPAPKRQKKTAKKTTASKIQKASTANNKTGDAGDGKIEKGGKQMKLSGWFTKPQK